jgi:hypothetical protein
MTRPQETRSKSAIFTSHTYPKPIRRSLKTPPGYGISAAGYWWACNVNGSEKLPCNDLWPRRAICHCRAFRLRTLGCCLLGGIQRLCEDLSTASATSLSTRRSLQGALAWLFHICRLRSRQWSPGMSTSLPTRGNTATLGLTPQASGAPATSGGQQVNLTK